MTVLVAVVCKDGIVVGCDSVATSSNGVVPIMQIKSNDKIRIFDDAIIVAATGAVGFTQRLHHHVEQAIKGSVFRNLDRRECSGNISSRFLKDIQGTNASMHPHHGIGFGALIACAIKDQPCLIEYASNNFQPEIKEGKLFFVSMGSGQPLADPFLAFISRVLWKDTLPDVRLGKLGVFWALDHTLKLAPGMVGPPIRMAILERDGKAWKASEAGDLQETEQYVIELEERIGQQTAGSIDEAVGSPLPPVPAR